jgi:hypothetical protein
MVCTDYQKHYDCFIFNDEFLEETVNSQLKVVHIYCFKSFLSVRFHIFMYKFSFCINKQC